MLRLKREQQRIVTASADGRARNKGERPLGSIHPILESKQTTIDMGYKHLALQWQDSFFYPISTSFYLSVYYRVLGKGREEQEKAGCCHSLCCHSTGTLHFPLLALLENAPFPGSLPHPTPQLSVLCSAGLWRISFTSTEPD